MEYMDSPGLVLFCGYLQLPLLEVRYSRGLNNCQYKVSTSLVELQHLMNVNIFVQLVFVDAFC